MTQIPVILLNDLSFPSQDVSNAAMTLATVLATIPVIFLTEGVGTAYQRLFSCCRYRCTDVQII